MVKAVNIFFVLRKVNQIKRDASYEERTDLHYSVGWELYHRHVVLTFNAKHRTQITHDTVTKLIVKFKTTGSAADANRSERPKTSTEEGTSTQVQAAMAGSLMNCTGRLSSQMGINQSSGMRKLRANI
ncbi:hypothetical protein AVEN_251947-1 [Araneus ventricosus]|uniref:DUF4817 domain-containing protein n=1 Tax=Araneus ventricosus TaxID=182803 RepID=A0A4Y2LQ74_ARAVE|nr:hypothetical protein AVEN_251947-1 [Araneus ventricosus]